jgi:micrococcal nuclease
VNAVRAAAALLALAALAGCSGQPSDEPPAGVSQILSGTVDRVVDGDTLVARVDGERIRVRLLGVDAPETATGRGSAECYGVEAADAARDLLSQGAGIALRTDPTQGREDRFGRLLAEVTVAGEARTVNETLVADGSAKVFRGDGQARLQPALREAERAARREGLGIWTACPGRSGY